LQEKPKTSRKRKRSIKMNWEMKGGMDANLKEDRDT
jgi:hypothetical protein